MTMSSNIGQFGDTTLTKVFVGGLAWETPKEALGRAFRKGYGFVTFKDAGAARKACEDAAPVINGRRANCNLASLGARRPRSATPAPPQQGPNIIAGPRSTPATPANHVQWYYPAGSAAASPYHHQHHQAVPFYGYSPAYIATDISYNHKLSYTGGSYMNGSFLSGVSRASYVPAIMSKPPSMAPPNAGTAGTGESFEKGGQERGGTY
ncbi:hypothetical protein OIU84_020626 [Salix udensis]|uniref:RRM domain-containing protein n=1 Tax=Salix udensis TaxID=889485 RepID=A0AAD6KSZ7_9ROSI|nr:hypothetical protein OIU84_020626 [Salix udensis]